MEFSGLGSVNSIANSIKNIPEGSNATGFGDVFGLLLSENTELETLVGSEDTAVMSANLINTQELLQFLNNEDILNIDGGMQLLDQILNSDDLDEILPLLTEFISKQSENETDKEFTTDVEVLLQSLLSLLSLPAKELIVVASGEMKDNIKLVKLFELISSEKPLFTDNKQLKDVVQELTNRLQKAVQESQSNLVQSTKTTPKFEFVQRTFYNLVNEMNAAQQNMTTSKDSLVKLTESKLEPVNGPILLQQMSKPEQLTLMVQNNNGKPVQTSELIKQFENILAKSQLSNVAGTQKLLIKLNPEHLGTLRIELIQRDAGIIARIMTSTQVAKDTLESHLNGLKHAFGSQNITVEKVEITQTMNMQQERFFNREQQQDSQRQWQEQEDKGDQQEDGSNEKSFNFSLEEAMINTEV